MFDSNGALVHALTVVSDNGNELGGGKPEYRVKLAEKLPDKGLIRDESMLKHRYTLSQTPSQAAFIERFNQTLRQKLRLNNYGRVTIDSRIPPFFDPLKCKAFVRRTEKKIAS